jgi:hypothetical protein
MDGSKESQAQSLPNKIPADHLVVKAVDYKCAEIIHAILYLVPPYKWIVRREIMN